jgi:hypothetical protein
VTADETVDCMGGGGQEGQAPARSSQPPSCHARSVEFPLAALPTGLLSLPPVGPRHNYPARHWFSACSADWFGLAEHCNG